MIDTNKIDETNLKYVCQNLKKDKEAYRLRNQLFTQGDYINAGKPWSLVTVNPKGESELTLIEFQ